MLLSCSFSGRSKLALRWCSDHSKSGILFPVYLYRGTPGLFLPNAMLKFYRDENNSENEHTSLTHQLENKSYSWKKWLSLSPGFSTVVCIVCNLVDIISVKMWLPGQGIRSEGQAKNTALLQGMLCEIFHM